MIRGAIGFVAGLLIIEHPLMVIQFRFPKSKKVRVRKKWRKNPLNFKPDPQIKIINDRLFAHPSVARAIMEHKDIKRRLFK